MVIAAPSAYGEAFADVYDDWYHDIGDPAATTAFVASLLAGGRPGPVLELGVGTGRLALPLAAAGHDVIGVDASRAMLRRLAAKPGSAAITLVEADMAALPPTIADASCAVALVAFNTVFNLDAPAQRRCLASVRTKLRPGGTLVVEAAVPAVDPGSAPASAERRRVGEDLVITLSSVGGDGRTVEGEHVHLCGDRVRRRPWSLHLRTPDELDDLATAAGYGRVGRFCDWDRSPFTPDSDAHVSLYRPIEDHRTARAKR